ncbi:MAG: Na+/H+ antiporter NhaC family protein [Planctomycetota bacterium]
MKLLGGRRLAMIVACMVLTTMTAWSAFSPDPSPQENGSFRASVQDEKVAIRNAPLDVKIEHVDLRGDTIPGFDWNGANLDIKGIDDLDGKAIESAALRPEPKDGRRTTIIEIDDGALLLRNVVLVDDVSVTYRAKKYDVIPDTVPGIVAILPALIAILLAIMFRQVLPALFAGVWVGGIFIAGGPWAGFRYVVTELIPTTLSDSSRLSILVFSCLLGSVVALIARMGGTRGLVDSMSKVGDSRRGAQLTTWFSGMLIFFDDYANALLVGNTMRPITDRFRVSREKLAFLVDSTSAPVACVVVISTWIAAEIGYIQGKLELEAVQIATGWTPDKAYQIFLETIPYNFYPIYCIAFCFFICLFQRDFGPMLKAERRAFHDGKVLADGAVPLSSREMDQLEPADPNRQYWWNAMIPIGTVIISVLGFLYITGAEVIEESHQSALQEIRALEFTRNSADTAVSEKLRLVSQIAVEENRAEALASPPLRDIFGAAKSYHALLLAAFLGVIAALICGMGQGLLRLGESFEVVTAGIKAMIPAVLVLTLAWALQDVCERSNTSQWLIHHITLKSTILPMLIFLLAAVIGFSTGTSWGTMGILVPLTMDYVVSLSVEESFMVAETQVLLVSSVGAVLAGAVFGDHCSPISDTTIMSSMSCGADHVDHVKTQLPYAFSVACIAILVGYLPAGFGISPWILLPLGILLCAVVIRVLGRRATDS